MQILYKTLIVFNYAVNRAEGLLILYEGECRSYKIYYIYNILLFTKTTLFVKSTL